MEDHITAFLAGRHYATVATTMDDGRPHGAVTWYRVDPDGTVLINSRAGRTWPANLRRTGQAYVAVIDREDGLNWVGLQCDLGEVVDDVVRARDDIVALAHRYHPEGPSPESIATYRSQERISFRLRPIRIHDHLGD